jgi:signal peptidase I
MEPDVPIGSVVHYAEKFLQSELKRGARVIVEIPDKPGSRSVMEIAAMPGDVVTISNEFLAINGNITRFKDIRPGRHEIRWLDNVKTGPGRMSIPSDHFLLLGTNSDLARDGRYWGPVPSANIKGVVIGIDFPN